MYAHRSGSGHARQYVHRDERGERRRDSHYEHREASSRRQHERSPQRPYHSMSRDRIRSGSGWRRSPSPSRTGSERKRRLCSGDYGERRSPENRHGRHSEESLRHSSSQEDDFHFRRSPPGRQHQESELMCTSRRMESTQGWSHGGAREVDDYKSGRSQDQRHEAVMSMSTTDLNNRSALPTETNASRGFQKFLELLNQGVNVDTLTRIVKVTTSIEAVKATVPECQERTSPRSEEGRDVCSSGPQSEVEEPQLSAEEQHRHKEMQQVLQAIGMDLGFDEVGQMSHRIQERLYGKKEAESANRGGRGIGGRPGSSSDRSDFLCFSQEEPAKNLQLPSDSPEVLPTSIPFLEQTSPQNCPATSPLVDCSPQFYRPPPRFPPLPGSFVCPTLAWPPPLPAVLAQRRPPVPLQMIVCQQTRAQTHFKPAGRQRCLQVVQIRK